MGPGANDSEAGGPQSTTLRTTPLNSPISLLPNARLVPSQQFPARTAVRAEKSHG